MKKTLTVMALLAGAASIYAQGQIGLSDYGSTFTIQVFGAQSLAASTQTVTWGGYTVQEEWGTSANGNLNNPSSSTFAAGSALGTGYDVELLGAAGQNQPLTALVEEGSVVSTWYTASGGNPTSGLSGFWKSTANASVSGAAAATSATVAIAAWNNEGGTITSLAAAQAAGDP